MVIFLALIPFLVFNSLNKLHVSEHVILQVLGMYNGNIYEVTKVFFQIQRTDGLEPSLLCGHPDPSNVMLL